MSIPNNGNVGKPFEERAALALEDIARSMAEMQKDLRGIHGALNKVVVAMPKK